MFVCRTGRGKSGTAMNAMKKSIVFCEILTVLQILEGDFAADELP